MVSAPTVANASFIAPRNVHMETLHTSPSDVELTVNTSAFTVCIEITKVNSNSLNDFIMILLWLFPFITIQRGIY